jgi:sensor histidine kinase YesM
VAWFLARIRYTSSPKPAQGNIAVRTRAVLARCFRGLDRRTLGVLVLAIAASNLFAWPIATAFDRGLSPNEIVAPYGRVLTADLIHYLPAIVGVAAWNLMRRSGIRGAVMTVAIIGGSAWLALIVARPILIPVYETFFDLSKFALGSWVQYFALNSLCVLALMLVDRERLAADALERERQQVLELDRGLAEARIQVTEAQIEPHFLFNTLANIRRLYAIDTVAGRAMLRDFAQMLGAALPSMRQSHSTLEREVSLAMAYLGVQKIRMGPRLVVELDLPQPLRGASFPSMMLPTLVENAVKHGLAPLRDGGTVRIAATADGAHLTVRVVDSGCGLRTSSGTGVGLANVVSRLEALYGKKGQFELEPNPDRGVTASIQIPLMLNDVPVHVP